MKTAQDKIDLASVEARIAAGLGCIGIQLSLVELVVGQGGGGNKERRDLWQMEHDQAELERERSRITDRMDLAARPLVVLVVDDEMLVLMSTSDDLRAAGFVVIEASNADEAIGLLQNNGTIRYLFTDVQMPGSMNGLELAKQVHLRWPSVKVVATSGNTQLGPNDLARGDQFIRKPYRMTEVVTALRSN
jgi:CheY-like chemotaxis protein